MFSSNLLLALAFSVLSVRVQATSQTCTFDLQASEEEPADPATSINNGQLLHFLGRAFYLRALCLLLYPTL